MLSDKVHFLIQSLYTFHISSGIIRQLHFLASAYALCAPIEISHIYRTSHFSGYSMEAGLPTLYRLAGTFRSKSQMNCFLRFHLLDDAECYIASFFSVYRNASKFSQKPSHRSPEKLTFHHTIWLSSDRHIIKV